MNFFLILICLFFVLQVVTNVILIVSIKSYIKQLNMVNNTNMEDLMNDFKFDTKSED